MENWILAGHVSQIPEHGDFFLLEFDKESVIITRTQTGEINALLNVCRHRGSHICLQNKGNTNALTCPYHAWSYNLDGKLLAARNMNDDFDNPPVILIWQMKARKGIYTAETPYCRA